MHKNAIKLRILKKVPPFFTGKSGKKFPKKLVTPLNKIRSALTVFAAKTQPSFLCNIQILCKTKE